MPNRLGYRDGSGVITSLPEIYADTGEVFNPQANPTYTLLFFDDNNFSVLQVGSEALPAATYDELAALAGAVGVGGVQVTDFAGILSNLGLSEIEDTSISVFDDFDGDVLEERWGTDTATGASVAISTVAGDHTVVLDSGASADEWATLVRRLIFPVSNSLTLIEARLKINDISDVIFEFGFSDALAEANGTAFSSHDATPVAVATNAAVFGWNADNTDVGEISTAFELNTVNADTAARATTTSVPVNDTYLNLSVVIDSDGDAGFFVNGTSAGSVEDAVATDAVLTPWITVVALQAAAARTVEVDWIRVSSTRS